MENGEQIRTDAGNLTVELNPQVPVRRVDPEKLVTAIGSMRALRARCGRLTLEEILSARDEGRA